MTDQGPGDMAGGDGAEEARRLRAAWEHPGDTGAMAIGPAIDAALQRWPGSRELALLQLAWLEAAGEEAPLRDALTRALAQFPRCAQVALFAFRAAIRDRAVVPAADLLQDVIWPARTEGGEREACLEALLRCAADDAFAEATLRRLLDAEPDCTAVLMQLAALDLRQGRHAEAVAHIEQAESAAPLPREAQGLRIQALSKADRWDDAFALSLDRALDATPEAPRLHELKLDLKLRQGETEAARAILEEARRRFPEDLRFDLCAFRLHLAEKDPPGAALLLHRIWRSPLLEGVRRGVLNMLVREWKDPDALRPVLEGLLQDAPDDRFVLVKLASLATRQRRHFESVQYLERAQQHGDLPPEAESMRINLLVLGGDTRGSLALAKELAAANPERKDLVRRANIVASIEGSQDDVTETMRQAIEHWPTDASVIQRYNRTILPEDEDRRLFERVASFSRANSVDGRWHYQFALACLRRQETPRACAMLRNLVEDTLVGFEARRLLGVLDALPAREWDARARFSNDAMQDVRVIRVPDAQATFVVMAGLHGGLGNLPLTHLDVLLQEHGVNVVYLRDNRWSAFTLGVPGLGADEASTVTALSALCADLGAMPVVTFGSSLGGWSAMRYGALMQAHVALSLAGPTRPITREERPARFAQHYLARMLPDHARDLLDLLRRSPSLHVMHVYGGSNPRDGANAARLRELTNVTLLPIEACDDHFVAAHLVATGGFHPVIRQAIATARAASSA